MRVTNVGYPFGYPLAVLVALVPPLWSRVIDPRVQEWRLNFPGATSEA